MTLERERHIVNQEFVFVPENLIRPTQETTEALRQFIVRTNQFAAADWRYCTQFVQDLPPEFGRLFGKLKDSLSALFPNSPNILERGLSLLRK